MNGCYDGIKRVKSVQEQNNINDEYSSIDNADKSSLAVKCQPKVRI